MRETKDSLGLTPSPAWDDGGQRIRHLLIPLGATEQHGPHLPLATDTIIATAWARAAAAQVGGAVVAPSLPYGSSGEHDGFAGTMSIGRAALRAVVVELVRSVAGFCDQVMLVSGHGGNVPVLGPIVDVLTDEGHRVGWIAPRWPPDIGVDAHAGHTETSLMLHLEPDLVGPFDTADGNTEPLDTLMPTLLDRGVIAVAPNGVLGNPSGATAEHGAELFTHLVDELVARLTQAS